MDFLGDPEAKTAYFSTVYFSHVKDSHNFRLPIPFANTSVWKWKIRGKKFDGYTEIQWEALKALPTIPATCRGLPHGAPTIPAETIEACKINGPGAIVALAAGPGRSPRTKESDLVCEPNQEIYLDGSQEPQMEYLGTEDCYGYSWGMAGGIQSDHYAAITPLTPISREDSSHCCVAAEQTESTSTAPAAG